MDSRLPEASRWRYRRRVRHGADRVGIALVVCAAVCAAVWIGGAVVVDLSPLHTVPEGLGFRMFSGHPSHGHGGFAAPLFVERARAGCDAQHTAFVLGMADLKVALGAIMGEPRECEHPSDADGNTTQGTTTGVAAYLRRTQTLKFTDGARYWVLTAAGL